MQREQSSGLFRKTWGASFTSADAGRFRLWAPDERAVSLILNGAAHEMQALDGGWFELSVKAQAGDRYCFQLSDGSLIADPASSAQQSGPSGPSILVDHCAYRWETSSWRGRPWGEAIICELHTGTFTPEGTFRAAGERLAHLADAGITAIEIMPVAQYPGMRGWGYDGVLHYAPHHAYGTPDDLKAFVDAAHSLGIMVLLDVVYNHFGPEENALPRYAAGFFNTDRATPWGASIAFEQDAVRRYFIENALYWLGDFRFDGLRLDATEQIRDSREPHILVEMAREIRETFPERHVHLVVEDAHRRRSLVARKSRGIPELFTAAWNDDLHNALHVAATGETKGHYQPFAVDTWWKIREAMAEGFASPAEGKEISSPWTGDRVPPQARVNFLQNHDQVGNRAFGERLASLVGEDLMRVLTATLMLVPQVPLLFMGEEYGETQPFCFFADYQGQIAEAIRSGRQREAENFGGMPHGATMADLPDPLDPRTFASSKLQWDRAESPAGRRHVAFIRELADIRQRHIAPLLEKPGLPDHRILPTDDGLVAVDWQFGSSVLQLRINLTDEAGAVPPIIGQPIFTMSGERAATAGELPGPGIVAAVARV
ncbi:malto-oligosyltrehalose trehalohydrolase [Sinorhizobium psoraleae]|uniref:Malto-oligosyltrehalose trehalohydrolase n=1 Tax=Sinorhizobium psoraleae TaxID=520838 RepID=A0ABT4KRH2_9HYPH|nr:malto-oligosyltrehalose trehalohydrolase [Sinorhizobium psoraleae]MCZ4094568.1 malto-oligosyltrehalose trehalohydrolase [Sinorhizobium psoraleae]